MFKNYFKTAFRNLKNSKTFSLINMLGLAVGMTACLLIVHFVWFETHYDNFHANGDRIYRLRYERHHTANGTSVQFASCCPPAGPLIRDAYPDVENLVRFVPRELVVTHENVKFVEKRLYFAEKEFFDIFDFKVLEGDARAALADPNRVLLTESSARRYFGDANPMGRTLRLHQDIDLTVAGIVADCPDNSHLKFDLLVSYPTLKQLLDPRIETSWGHTTFFTYILLREGADPAELENQFAQLVEAQAGELMKAYDLVIKLVMQPIRDIHLSSHFLQEFEANGDRNTVRFLFIIAGFILLTAWINYINLTTARALSRAREVGLRKTVGATRAQIRFQFFLETLLLNLISIVLACGLSELMLPLFRHITSMPKTWPLWSQPWIWPALAALLIVGTVLSGWYPMTTLSTFDPVKTLKGRLSSSRSGIRLRKGLVLFQYIVALLLVSGTLAVLFQIQYLQKQDLGVTIDRTLVLQAPRIRGEGYEKQYESFKNEILKIPAVQGISYSSEVPGRQIYWDAGGIYPKGADISESKNYMIMGVDYDFADLYGLTLTHGRTFSREFPTDKAGLLMNERAVQWMGLGTPREAVGREISYWGQIYTLLGVIKDYHQQSPKADFEPTIFRLETSGRGVFSLRLNSSDMPKTVNTVKEMYNTFFPANPFQFFFLDDYYNEQYKSDRRVSGVVGLFAGLALFVTALGLFGLSLFTATARTKEIGIRKVLGAEVSGIVFLLTREFLLLILAAQIVALPLILVGLQLWLNTFAVRMTPGAPLFALPLLTVFLMTGLTIGFQTVKSACTNPVESLRYE